MLRIKALKGFTLSELLISMAILGLISAFAIPKVLQSAEEQQMKAKFRETYATLSQFYQEIVLNGEGGSGVDLKARLKTRLNVTRFCDNNIVANGCWTSSMAVPSDPINQAAFILPNGVYVSDFNATPSNDAFYMDLNGPDGPNTLGQDTICIGVCLNEAQASGCGTNSWKATAYTGPTNAGSLYPVIWTSMPLWDRWTR